MGRKLNYEHNIRQEPTRIIGSCIGSYCNNVNHSLTQPRTQGIFWGGGGKAFPFSKGKSPGSEVESKLTFDCVL